MDEKTLIQKKKELEERKKEILFKYTQITVKNYEEKTTTCNAGHQELGYDFVEECDELGIYEEEKKINEQIKRARN